MVQQERLHGLIREVDDAGFISRGHYEFRSGRHALRLLDRDRLLCDTHLASRMGYALARRFFLVRADVIATPSVWGAGLAQWVGFFLEPRRPVVYPTVADGKYAFPDAEIALLDGKRVLVIDNLILSGKTAQDFVHAISANGGTPIGIGALADFSGIDFPIPAYGLLNEHLEIYDATDCPACARGEPVVAVGY
jgi:orotate phosphoribosyltransferase